MRMSEPTIKRNKGNVRTVYLSDEANEALTKLYIDDINLNGRGNYSSIVCDAILAYYNDKFLINQASKARKLR